MHTLFHPNKFKLTPFLFFTGKGGVGKTSTACATAVSLAEEGKKVLLVSTDPASNLQDVFDVELTNKPTPIPSIENLSVANIDPEISAKEYKDNVVGPYRDKLPEAVINQMEEQLSGACTVEISAFDEFSSLLTDEGIRQTYDHVIFDTAPTGHTLRLLQLPTAWSGFLDENTHGASCLGPLAGLEAKKELYNAAVQSLSDPKQTTLMLVTRPEVSPLLEVTKASKELGEIGINNQTLLVNGVMKNYVKEDETSTVFYQRQQQALTSMPDELKNIPTYEIQLAPFNIAGIENMRRLFDETFPTDQNKESFVDIETPHLQKLIDDIQKSKQRIIFTMGKGGVGKTTVAAAIAIGLSEKGEKVHLTTTDPAAHIDEVLNHQTGNITVSRIDPKAEVEKYQQEVIEASKHELDEEGIAYLEEDLRSPCTEEIAVFRAFANIVEKANDEIIVIDTAPTGHTLLLLDSTQAYHKEMERSTGEVPLSVQQLLPRLRNPKETTVVIVTLAEATPVHEASRLQEDLNRANITPKWWVINQSLYATHTIDPILHGRSVSEIEWIKKVEKYSNNNYVIIPWKIKNPVGYEAIKELTIDTEEVYK
ncbi:arsenical pump-driving ATPase [Virgibacillus pantothenticus]|uniref:arsenical pump-driving ATPase n=1 Tax=Virgibacillus pantothenticus TaxID=1473 RepID=UPI001C228195|nr:arsenical pump-driving ATPase [Virgibacillus pantothenticus]MBU8567147.1 arsenical pump-driving ATPase [Virgibacillus pantothenticus]MBU8600821.1 arsenical pump-driving ATPase [Virgibacillus pantothenticus]MBU8635299.1 arsenical pump-driving ATPase [Virgibacillus pantothenticus]MBU8642999.1 arsenical pump-driving ATPase [Virgibacillus pantothenticus]MBU8646981.1 arsenical pump-driving ATPase [Virgibacillus pantothenticus]